MPRLLIEWEMLLMEWKGQIWYGAIQWHVMIFFQRLSTNSDPWMTLLPNNRRFCCECKTQWIVCFHCVNLSSIKSNSHYLTLPFFCSLGNHFQCNYFISMISVTIEPERIPLSLVRFVFFFLVVELIFFLR